MQLEYGGNDAQLNENTVFRIMFRNQFTSCRYRRIVVTRKVLSMRLPTMVECEEMMRPHHGRIRGVFTDAWAEYQRLQGIAPYLLDYKRGRANDVHAAMKWLARDRFGDEPSDAYYIPHEPESFMILVNQRLHTRFKKLDRETLRPSNVATDQNDEMLRQFPLPQHGPDPIYLIAGYVLNELETAVESTHVILPLGGYNFWSYEIDDDGVASNVIEMPTIWPLDDVTKTAVRPRSRITPKKKTNDDEVS